MPPATVSRPTAAREPARTERDREAWDPGFLPGEIAVLRTDWTDKHWGTEAFFAQPPYLTTEAATWLVEKKAKAIVYDFSEEYVVPKPGFRGEECEVHHIILGNGLWNIEYVTGLGRLKSPSTPSPSNSSGSMHRPPA